MKVHLYYIGKPRDAHANAMAEEYVKRASRFARCEMREIQSGRFDPWERHPAARIILLEAAGEVVNSAQFTALLGKAEQENRDLVFVVGGAEGYPAGWRERPGMRLALSALTLPHELARVVLAEQIYRAFATLRRHPYPR